MVKFMEGVAIVLDIVAAIPLVLMGDTDPDTESMGTVPYAASLMFGCIILLGALLILLLALSVLGCLVYYHTVPIVTLIGAFGVFCLIAHMRKVVDRPKKGK